jgi:hypothetical protein
MKGQRLFAGAEQELCGFSSGFEQARAKLEIE